MSKIVTKDTGERVVPASRRPDGTLRKEIRVREGYTPVDEMQKYVPRAARGPAGPKLCLNNANQIPGMDDAELEAIKGQAQKNKAPASKPAGAALAAAALGSLSLEAKKPRASAAAPSTSAAPSAPAQPAADPDDPVVQLEKKLRTIKKKIRECEEKLVNKAPDALEASEKLKIAKLPEFKEEAAALERQIEAARAAQGS